MSEYDVKSSIAFSTELIKEINTYALSIDNRLFFASGYNPKPLKNGCGELQFWIAITNLYGLFEDCSNPFTRGELLDVFNRNKLIDLKAVKNIRDFRDSVSSTRSIFCHNNSGETGFVIKQYKDFLAFLRELCACDDMIQSIVKPLYTHEAPCTPELTNELWFEAMESVCRKADDYIKNITDAICLLPSSNKVETISKAWLEAISIRSKNNGITRYQVLYDTCKRLVAEAKISSSERDIRSWVNKKENEIKKNTNLEEIYDEVIFSATKPPTSVETAHKVIILCEERGYVQLRL